MNENQCPICESNDVKELSRLEEGIVNDIYYFFIFRYTRCRDCESAYFTFPQSRRNKIEQLYALQKCNQLVK